MADRPCARGHARTNTPPTANQSLVRTTTLTAPLVARIGCYPTPARERLMLTAALGEDLFCDANCRDLGLITPFLKTDRPVPSAGSGAACN